MPLASGCNELQDCVPDVCSQGLSSGLREPEQGIGGRAEGLRADAGSRGEVALQQTHEIRVYRVSCT